MNTPDKLSPPEIDPAQEDPVHVGAEAAKRSLMPSFSAAHDGGIYPRTIVQEEQVPAEVQALQQQKEVVEQRNRQLEEQGENKDSEIARLAQKARIDRLTGLFLREPLEDSYTGIRNNYLKLKQERSDKTDNAYLLVLDLDDFKAINDTKGHGKGDKLLQKVAEVMQKNVRQRDVVARWGGDEFVILLPRITDERAADIAAAIREEVTDGTPITVSIGIGKVDFSLELEENVDLADQALLAAKQSGKNIVVHFDQLNRAAS